MGQRDHNRLLQQVRYLPSRKKERPMQINSLDDPDPVQDGGGLAVGSDGEDPDNHGEAESDAGRTQSVNDPFRDK